MRFGSLDAASPGDRTRALRVAFFLVGAWAIASPFSTGHAGQPHLQSRARWFSGSGLAAMMASNQPTRNASGGARHERIDARSCHETKTPPHPDAKASGSAIAVPLERTAETAAKLPRIRHPTNRRQLQLCPLLHWRRGSG